MIYGIDNQYKIGYGDYGDIIWCGFIPYDESKKCFYAERVGPFVPSIYTPTSGYLIATDDFKLAYEKSGLVGLKIEKSIEKRKIVHIDWEQWDLSKSIFDYIDETIVEEPEDILFKGVHNQAVADKMPNLWLVEFNDKINQKELTEDPIGDFWASSVTLHFFMSEKAKKWMEAERFIDYLELKEVTYEAE